MDNGTTPCPLDVEYADQIAALLAPPSPESVKDYYDSVLKSIHCHGLEVKHACDFGKAIYASKQYIEEELILKDQPLVASQHTSNKIDCLVCSYCFRYVGSIELQIGRRLYLHGLRSLADQECNDESYSDISEDTHQVDELGAEDIPTTSNCDKMHTCSSRDLKIKPGCISEGVLESLMNGDLTLPYSKKIPLPPVISCPGGCEEEHYCSELCAELDWETSHSLLCTGEGSKSLQRESLVKFMEHANRTNDIFILAAKVISSTILKYKKLKYVNSRGQEQNCQPNGKDDTYFSLLCEAWKPISMGFKKSIVNMCQKLERDDFLSQVYRWWDSVALPDDVGHTEEHSFRMQIRDLAFASLKLLKEAIFDKECAPLFSLEIYGHIVGMFELNNLDLVVASPVEDYFIYIDDLPTHEKEKAEKQTRTFLDALGDDYSDCCEGTAFFPLQSCMNHSCLPNAKAFKRDEDRDGQAILLALRPIAKGEEITISYIDEDLPYEERQKQLADYGFKCQCTRCLEEGP